MKIADKSLEELEEEILECEKNLQELRDEYMVRKGHMPLRKLNESSWKWTIFMTLGFCFITMIVYLLGIRKAGSALGLGIPDFFFETEISYFAILTFYMLITLLMAQYKKLSGMQSMSLILGFWCAHWLIYDWGWWAYMYGIGNITDPAAFWLDTFGNDLLIPDPTMTLFLVIAILGAFMSIYTFSIPKKRRHLIPPILWLYTSYFNPSILSIFELNSMIIIAIAITLTIISFVVAGFYTFQRIRKGLPNWIKNFGKNIFNIKRKWTIDPLGFPIILIMLCMLLMTHLFLALNPAIGLYLGMIPWFFVPTYYILIHSTGLAKARRINKIIAMGLLTTLFVVFIIILSVLPIGEFF
jgi:hypothetical protein